MANKRELKKDIRYLTEQVIIDALEVSEMLEKEADKKKVLKIIVSVAELHNSLISRVNRPDGKDNPKLVKIHFNKILEDLMGSCSSAYEKLNKLLPEK
ncbi:MAG: hypothetical protein PF541_18600 [Prolixibacteraceae bacterium]|jgi:aconitase B|nr:hypothetical protein [Prolixibacteraceae bacterium]